MERCLFLLQAAWMLWRKGGCCRAGALGQEGWLGHLTSMPGSAACWGLPFKCEVRNGELRALPKRHLLGRLELLDRSGPRVPHHVPHRCALCVCPLRMLYASPPSGDSVLGKTMGNWTTRHPAPLCPDKACGSSERRWPWDPPAMETSSHAEAFAGRGCIAWLPSRAPSFAAHTRTACRGGKCLVSTYFFFYTTLLKKT